MRAFSTIALTWTSLSGAWAALGSTGAAAQNIVVDQVVAFVDDQPIFLSEVRERVTLLRNAPADPERPESVDVLAREIVQAIVDELLVAREAERLGIGISDSELDRALEELRRTNGLDEERMRQTILDQGWTLAAYNAAIRRELLRMRVLQHLVRSVAPISEAEVRRAWEQRSRTAPRVRRYRLSHVSIVVSEIAPATERTDARRRAEVLHEELRRRAITFDEAVRREGGASAEWFDESALDEHVRSSVARTPDGGMTGVIETAMGFLIAMVYERADARGSFDEERQAIRQELERERLSEAQTRAIERLRSNAYVVQRFESTRRD